MLMVPHFHYDPVWWNTQAAYTSGWDELVWAQDRRETFQHSGLALVEAHLERTRIDPLYKVVFAEVDYLKPFWDLYPDRRQELRDLIAAGRVEIVGGTYNEPNTNLTGAETAIRAAVYGLGFQRDVMGAHPQSAWQLDVFGHDPQFPGIMAEAGLTSSAWARGPFHQWGPKASTGSTAWMQFPSEFEWVAPNGKGLLTSYMPTHYSAGWELERATTVEGAMWRAYELLEDLALVAATKVTLLPVGTDYTPPSRWVTEVAKEWGRRYAWPRFEVALPREFFDAVRSELARQGRVPSPQTRDMNPVYTGKDVSFIDTKQAQRLAETELADAEALAALATALGAPVPRRELDKAWRQLVFNAHHDGITGSESDQVYLDLLGGWREAYELAHRVAERASAHLVEAIDTSAPGAPGASGATDDDDRPAVVVNTLGWDRSGLAVLDVPAPAAGQAVEVVDGAGRPVPVLCEPSPAPGSVRLSFRADDVPGVGYSTYRARRRPAGATGGTAAWAAVPGVVIANEHLEIAADPARGGGLRQVTDRASRFELVPEGEVGNELLVYPEYANHPRFGEGPWHLLPLGPPARSGSGAATVRAERSDLGQRLVVDGALRGFGYHQVVTLWNGARRAELRTELHGWAIQDHLLRLRFPTTLAGGTPVSAVGDAVVARGFGLIDVDSADEPWTLDNPAAEWFGVSTTLVVEAAEAGRSYHRRGMGVAEVVTPVGGGAAPWARRLVVALVQKGVTATCTEADRNRYGALHGDSNLPDFRVAVGGPGENPFVAAVLQAAGPAYGAALDAQLAHQGWARLLVPAARSLREVWQPGADLRGPLELPVIVVAGADETSTIAAVDALQAEVVAGRIVVDQPAALVPRPEQVPEWTAALLNRGTPGFAVDSSGALHVSLLRACTGWPSGVWIDPPRRFAPDGSAFELEHWSHVFENALFLGRGDWRQAGCVEEALAYNRPLRTSLTAAHPGTLPPTARLLSVRPRPGDDRGGRAVLAVVKPAGNSLAAGDTDVASTSAGAEITLRLYEAHGHPAEVEVESAFPIIGATRANLLEEPGELLPRTGGGGATGALRLGLAASELATFRLGLGPATGTAATGGEDPGAEVAQPVFSRYWLHNKGPAPMGNQSLAVHVLPTGLVLRSGEAADFIAQVASGSASSSQSGQVKVLAPADWGVEPSGQLFSLRAGASIQVPARLEVPAGSRPGRYFVAVRVDGPGDQAQEDVLTVDVLPALAEAATGLAKGFPPGGPGSLLAKPATLAHPGGQVEAELELALETLDLAVGPARSATIGIGLSNRTAAEIRGELQLLSPVETWPYVGPWAQGFAMGPGQHIRAEASVRSPEQGWLDSWALFKVTYFGRLWYSPAVALRLGTRPGA
jgi:alpha-mannosidase